MNHYAHNYYPPVRSLPVATCSLSQLFHSLIPSPFTNKPLYISMSLLHQYKNSRERKLARSVLAQRREWWTCLPRDLWHSAFELTPGWEQFHWMSFIHTFSARGSFQLEAGVDQSHVDGAEDPDSICNMPSIRSSWVGEHTQRLDNEPVTSNTWKTQLCIWKEALWSFCRTIHLFSFIHWFICKFICSLCFFSQFKDELPEILYQAE